LYTVRSMNPPSARQGILSLSIALLAANLSCFAVASARETPRQDATKLVIVAPKPEYPDQARWHHQHGNGVFLLRTNIQSGRVTQVIVGQSTGNGLLDGAALKALRQWRFKPGALIYREITKPRLTPPLSKEESLVLIPVTF
jgi:TonB family protein